MLLVMFFNALLALALRTYFVYRNKRLDEAERRLGTGDTTLAGPGTGPSGTELEGTAGYRHVL